MLNPLTRYTQWLHTRWPAGTVERLPRVREDGTCSVRGVYIVGDLTGIPLLKFALDSGARAVERIAADLEKEGERRGDRGPLDLVIVGGGVAGMAAAVEAKRRGMCFEVLEASQPFSTIANFPARKPIYVYPNAMTPAGALQVGADVKEALVEELEAQVAEHGIETRPARAERIVRRGGSLVVELAEGAGRIEARRVIVAIGRSGNYRKLDVPGEDRDKVFNRLHDAKDFADMKVLVVGGGDSALEAAAALAESGAATTLSYRRAEFSRAKSESVEAVMALAAKKDGRLQLELASEVEEIRERSVLLKTRSGSKEIANDAVFPMIGRDAPLGFFRQSRIAIAGEWRWTTYLSLFLVLAAAFFVYHWKKSGTWIPINETFWENDWFPFKVTAWWEGLGPKFANPAHLLGVLSVDVGDPSFYYTVAYTLAIVGFGIDRIVRRRTPYVFAQTTTLAAIQIVPLFLLPYILLPWAGANGWFDHGPLGGIADELFPAVDYGHGREYWRAFGFILAWPLFFWNIFTDQPMWGWLWISLVQTFVLIPLIVYKWGKGAYCGWICSCGALAETMGDRHRHKMPHGPLWNRFNMLGQVFLLLAFVLLALRVASWIVSPAAATWDGYAASAPEAWFDWLFHDLPVLNYSWFVDLFWAGILGVGMYWHFSGRVWCRFACPLAALMHIYARFSKFRIFAEKKKCISCNVCTSVCHQGIDIMNFANKGLPMEDPECVRCSACVQSCPTGVLQFGEIAPDGTIARLDRLAASPVLMREQDGAAR